MRALMLQPLLRGARLLRRRVLGSSLKVVFDQGYTAAYPGVPLDALRAEHILAFLAAEGLVLRRSIHRPEAASLRALLRVHSGEYLDSVHEPEVMTSIVGVEVAPGQVDRLLDEQRLQVGGTVLAFSMASRGCPVVNLGGGFHHAHRDQGSGFCLFNDLALAIEARRCRGFRGRVLIVDLDLHDGDGTRDIFRRDSTVHTFSMHARHWGDIEAEESTSLELGEQVEDGQYLKILEAELLPVVERFKPAMVLYVAGTDPAADDHLGDWQLSASGLIARDRLVAEAAEQASAGLCVVLAGGYGPDAWRYSARFLAHLECGRALEPPTTEVMTLARYRYIAGLFSSVELSGGVESNEFGFTEADLALPGWSGMRESRFLGFYTKHAIELVLERAGMLDRLRDLGFHSPSLELQLDNPAGHSLSIFGDVDRSELLVELRLRRDRRILEGRELLSVEWLLMQNPRLDFSHARPRLPGQEHPGLGMLPDVASLLILVCERLHLDGLTFVPSQFHIAVLGGSSMFFADPAAQELFDALQQLFGETPLAAATQAVAAGRVRDLDSGNVVHWQPAAMVLPVSPSLRQSSREGRQASEAVNRPRLALD